MEDFRRLRPRDGQFVKVTRCIDCGAQRIDATGQFEEKRRDD
jgi:hypothetical protein